MKICINCTECRNWHTKRFRLWFANLPVHALSTIITKRLHALLIHSLTKFWPMFICCSTHFQKLMRQRSVEETRLSAHRNPATFVMNSFSDKHAIQITFSMTIASFTMGCMYMYTIIKMMKKKKDINFTPLCKLFHLIPYVSQYRFQSWWKTLEWFSQTPLPSTLLVVKYEKTSMPKAGNEPILGQHTCKCVTMIKLIHLMWIFNDQSSI